MHAAVRQQKIKGRGGKGKVVVAGSLQRPENGEPSKVHAAVVEQRDNPTLQAYVRSTVEPGSTLYSDKL